jgi:hypothetical protein
MTKENPIARIWTERKSHFSDLKLSVVSVNNEYFWTEFPFFKLD